MFAQPAAGLAGTARGHEAQALLRNCVHCGFCLPACPTYRVTGCELETVLAQAANRGKSACWNFQFTDAAGTATQRATAYCR